MAKKRDDPAAEAPAGPDHEAGGHDAPELDTKRPAHKVRLGRIVGCVWQNHNEGGSYYSATVQRIYKADGADHWMSATSFGRDDLLVVAKVADVLHTWIHEAQQSEGSTPF